MHKKANLAAPPPLSHWVARGPVALFLDFDGTLIDIAATPGGIRVPPDFARRLEALGDRLGGRLAIVSGRSLADIGAHIGACAVQLIGSHGAEQSMTVTNNDDAFPQTVRDSVVAFATGRPGLLVEDKPHGVALHYRQEPDAAETVLMFMDELARRENVAVRRGKMVVELGPRGASKGAAVARLMTQAPFVGAVPLFIGDDITDEDGFAAVAEAGGHGILVGDARPTAAHYRLSDPQQVHQWLTL